jgi:hypothetical protein
MAGMFFSLQFFFVGADKIGLQRYSFNISKQEILEFFLGSGGGNAYFPGPAHTGHSSPVTSCFKKRTISWINS